MRVISRKRLREFWESHPEALGPLTRWFNVVDRAVWRRPSDVRATFRSVDFVTGPDRTLAIFDIGGNKSRVSAAIHYNTCLVYVRHVMTHAEYDEGIWKEDL
jgi:mRNA interferase HigB